MIASFMEISIWLLLTKDVQTPLQAQFCWQHVLRIVCIQWGLLPTKLWLRADPAAHCPLSQRLAADSVQSLREIQTTTGLNLVQVDKVQTAEKYREQIINREK